MQDWLPEGHLARFVAEVVEALDLGPIYAKYEAGDGRGLAAYDPRLMVRVLIYGYCRGVASSRRIERATYETTTRWRRSAKSTWRLWRSCSCKFCSCASGRDW